MSHAAILLFLAAAGGLAPAPDVESAGSELPRAVHLEGVPYVSWSEAREFRFPEHEIWSPSVPAMQAMLQLSWGLDARIEQGRMSEEAGWIDLGKEGDASLEDLKRVLARGVPAAVVSALTPEAHYLAIPAVTMIFLGEVEGVSLPDPAPNSGLLGHVASFDVFDRCAESFWDPRNESALLVGRVAVGYDDDRGVIQLHDPSFGPDFELSYEDFERAWEPFGRRFAAMHHPELPEPPRREPRASHRPRTPDDQARWHWVRAYGLAAAGDPDGAMAELRLGLEVAGTSAGLQHLMLLELAVFERRRGNAPAALEAAERALRLVPENYVGWLILGELHAESHARGSRKLARRHAREAERLRSDRRAHAAVRRALPHDLPFRF